MPSDDELALTATAPAPRASAKHLARETLGRFKLERELGAGGMGVVHAAFDPDLERRVALKVLRASSDDARARLLREARAMAKLQHPNVITVFDVGSVDGEDFVAMELIDGGTLGDWLHRARPGRREILAAFLSAGRGLAAAHAEGLVHRDFKPNNVLRSRSGRIVVTDFGLARAEGTEDRAVEPSHAAAKGIALDETLGPTAPALTRTGSLLGTPAYMSPEQWRSGTVTPATDQFAFCVALWEAFAGKRPFEGDTLDDLRARVLRGPATLDASAIPRRFRAVLRRGLSLDPAQRWPSMSALLHAIERVNKRRYAALAIGVAIVASGAAIFLATRPSASPCAPPAIDPDGVAVVAAGRPHLDRWREARDRACHAPREVRSSRLVCLDAVFARMVDLFGHARPEPDGLAVELVDPTVCEQVPPPRLALSIDARLSQAFAALRRARETRKPVEVPLVGDDQPPCVRALALLARLIEPTTDSAPTDSAKAASLSAQLDTAAQACDDDAIQAQARLLAADPDDVRTVRRAEAAAEQFPDDANLARLDELHARQAARANHYDDALAGYERARAHDAAAGRAQGELDAVIRSARTHLARSDEADLKAVLELAKRYAVAARTLGRATELATLAARAHWRQGDVALGDAEARAANYHYGAAVFVDTTTPTVDVTGIVLDADNKPVANAKVVAAAVLWGDDAELSSPVAHIATPSETTTGPDGKFELRGARGTVIAALGDRASLPTKAGPNLTLHLGPTATIKGDVALGAVSPGRVRVIALILGKDTAAFHAGPVDHAGHFKLIGIPRRKVGFAAIAADQVSGFKPQVMEISSPHVTGVHLAFEIAAGQLYVIGRSETSTTPETALVMVFRGAHADAKGTFREVFRTLGGPVGQINLGPPDMNELPAPLQGHAEADDLIGELASRPAGDLTICAVGLSRKLLATGTSVDKLVALVQDADAGCVVVPAGAAIATVSIPAIKRRR